GLEDVADQKCVIALALGPEAVVEDLAGVAVFEVAVLIGDRLAGAEPVHRDGGAGRGGLVEDRRQPLRIGAAGRAPRRAEALVEQPHAGSPRRCPKALRSVTRGQASGMMGAMDDDLGLPPGAFARLDEEDDEAFYEPARLVVHIDD